MGGRSTRYVAAAREAAEWLDSNGQHKRANDVRNVCRSNEAFRTTLAQLHQDNMALRARIEAKDGC